ncbi:MAG: four helix bundle protein [Pseudomonadota bacterium]
MVVWQDAMDLAEHCYRSTRSFPRNEMYGMTSQIRSASSSVSASTAEGNGRESTGASIQFLRVSQGSLKELETHLLPARRVELLDKVSADALLARCEKTGKLPGALIRALQAREART